MTMPSWPPPAQPPTWPPPVSSPTLPPVSRPAGPPVHPAGRPFPPPAPTRRPGPTTYLLVGGAAAAGLVLGIAIGAVAAGGESSGRTETASPPVTRTVTVTADPAVAVPSFTTPVAPIPPSSPSVESPSVESPAVEPPAGGPLTTLGPGTYEVGTGPGQAAPGKYRSAGPVEDSFPACYYARLKNNDGSLGDILDNNVTEGPSVFTIKSGDGYVEISGCSFTRG